jgi:RNA polymerase sigma-70 factor, ECF subfamily
MTAPPASNPGGDAHAAFERYVLPEVEVMLRVARALTRSSADAEDLVQDTMIRALRSIERFDGRHPRAWLLTILRNTHINRNRRRRPQLLDDPDSAFNDLAVVASADRADTSVEAAFDAEIDRALAALDPPFRQVIQLVDVDGLTYAEAAEAIGVPTGTVMSRLHRARSRIREQLRDAGVAPEAQP